MSGKKNTGLFKGLLTVLILAVLVYFVIYLFFPDTSLKYFNTALDRQKAVEKSITVLIDKADYRSEEEREKVEEYLSSEDGKAFIKGISSAVNEGVDGIKRFTETDTFRAFEEKMSEILSPESYEKLTERIEDGASSLLKK